MISVIIPVYNEEEQIGRTISFLKKNDVENVVKEVIVADGGSTDDTTIIAKDSGAIVVTSERKGRAVQMNKGAFAAKNKILYFLHADSIPPRNFTSQILNAYNNGATSGCFRLAFDYNHWFLKANAWFTRFDVNGVRFGDQSLFVSKEVFEKAGGFKEDLLMMEDQEIIHRLKLHGKFKVMNDVVITSARKYLDNGVYRMQGIFYRIWALYYLGYSQEQLLKLHKRLIRNHKL
jgi:rSAM/selenodomain-associated transferase 2